MAFLNNCRTECGALGESNEIMETSRSWRAWPLPLGQRPEEATQVYNALFTETLRTQQKVAIADEITDVIGQMRLGRWG